MKEVLMSENEYQEYKKWKENKEKFSQMKQNGELFYIEVQPIYRDTSAREPWGSPKIWG